MANYMGFLARWSLFGLVLAILLKAESHSKKPLPSLHVAPSELYTPGFYPNGTDLKLPMGTMRYWLFGNPQGRRVILIHGIATGAASYDKLGRSLADEGHHVLVYDLFGRGYSDAPAGLYDESLYTTQIALLLQKVGWVKTDVVGVSLGGGIATSFAAYYPEMVDKLVLIAPAGLMQDKDIPLTGKLVKLPLLSKIALHPWLRPVALKGVTQFFKSSRKGDQTTEEAIKVQKIAFHQFAHHPGFLRAFFGTITDYPLHDLHERYKAVGQNKDLAVLVLWGDADKTVPFEHHKILQEYVPQARVSRYEGGGHDIMLTHWQRVDKEVAEFLQ